MTRCRTYCCSRDKARCSSVQKAPYQHASAQLGRPALPPPSRRSLRSWGERPRVMPRLCWLCSVAHAWLVWLTCCGQTLLSTSPGKKPALGPIENHQSTLPLLLTIEIQAKLIEVPARRLHPHVVVHVLSAVQAHGHGVRQGLARHSREPKEMYQTKWQGRRVRGWGHTKPSLVIKHDTLGNDEKQGDVGNRNK